MSEEIDRWIKYMKDNPDKWKAVHTKFINAQFQKQREFMKRLLKEPDGKQRLINAYNIKNLKFSTSEMNSRQQSPSCCSFF